ncbi:hypothetical protein J3F83DRAFT_754715 [Trichoderma novae-zelandiae]
MSASITPKSTSSDDSKNNHPPALLSTAYSYAKTSLDAAIPPSTRQRAYDKLSSFASSQPILFSFTAFQLLFSLLPLTLFLSFALSTLLLTLSAAFAFVLFWIGVASLFLIPTLFITSSLAVLCWGASVGSFVLGRTLYHYAPAGAHPGKSSGSPSSGIKTTPEGTGEAALKGDQVKREGQFPDIKNSV